MQRTAAPEECLEMAVNSFSMYPGFSDPCRAHIYLMGLTGLEGLRGEGSEVTDCGGPKVQHQDISAETDGSRVMAPWRGVSHILGLKQSCTQAHFHTNGALMLKL